MEYKPKKRDWVKNAAIIFLSVLLVLTFFSNTLMNRSLPEVATQSVTNGTITAKVRGTGTVTAVGVTTMKAEQTRDIRAVMVKVGQEVEVGDVLFVLGQGEASALEAAQEQLRQLQLSYQKTAVGVISPDYSLQEHQIANARQAVQDARDILLTITKKIDNSKLPVKQLEAANAEVTSCSAVLQTAKDDLAAAKVEYDTAKQAYETKIAEIEEKWGQIKELDNQDLTEKLNVYDQAAATVLELTAKRDEASQKYITADADYSALNLKRQEQLEQGIPEGETEITQEMVDEAWKTREAANEVLVQAEEVLASAQQDAADKAANAEAAQKKLDDDTLAGDEERKGISDASVIEAGDKVKALEVAVADAEESLQIAVEKRDAIQATVEEIIGQDTISTEYKDAQAAVQAAEDKLFELEYNLQQQKVTDSKSQSMDYLSLSDIGAQIEAAKKKVEELSGGEENQVVAKVHGTVQSIECAPGDTKVKGDILCTIEVPDMGYSLSFSVTNDQARRLKVGDSATVSNYYWGNQVTATLESIKTDPKNPQTNKILNFDVTGDVTAGSEITISVGQKSANYDIIIPNSAIRSDTNGSFVLAVESKSSPLGNRYIARRVEVKVLAEDDMNSAVTADLGFGDYVITTSNAPVKNGDMVRLADN